MFVRSIGCALVLAVLVLLPFVPATAASPSSAPSANGYLANCTGEYFNNITLTDSPTTVRTDPAINFVWGENVSPAPGINGNNYGVRWTCNANVTTATNYTFTMVADDGMNLILDGNPIIWAWYDQGPTAYVTTVALSAGWHTLKVEYYNRTLGGTAQVSSNLITAPPPPSVAVLPPTVVPPPPPVYSNWKGEYFNNQTLSGAPAITRNDANINFDWGEGSPNPAIPVDYFSARWTRTVNLSAGTWRFTITNDDGVRVWIDGYLIMDKWFPQPPTTYLVDVVVIAGNHEIKMEYFEERLGAIAKLTFAPASMVMPSPPPPGTDVVVDNKGPGWQASGTGTWRNAAVGENNHSFWTYNNPYTQPGYNWARWYPTLPAPGSYEVFAFIPDNLATTLNARYWVYHNNRYDLAPRAQGFYPNQWMSLGTYYFHAQGGEYVSLADVTYECYLCRTLVFDAIKFSPR